jgi:peptidoglycan biosynthesis protein MviN/MurJ (putative lipid II flippase)
MKHAGFPRLAAAMTCVSAVMAALYLIRILEPGSTNWTLFVLIVWVLLALANAVALTIGLRRWAHARR